MSVRLTHSINIIYNDAGVATPDPGEAPPLAGFNMKSQVAYIAHVRLFLPAVPCKNQEASPQSAQSPQREGGAEVGEEGVFFIQVTVPGSLPAENDRLL